MFESLDCSECKVRVELYIEKVPIDLVKSSTKIFRSSKVGSDSENTSGKKVQRVYTRVVVIVQVIVQGS